MKYKEYVNKHFNKFKKQHSVETISSGVDPASDLMHQYSWDNVVLLEDTMLELERVADLFQIYFANSAYVVAARLKVARHEPSDL